MLKALQGHSTKLNQTKRQKGQSPTVSSRRQTTVIGLLRSTITIASLSNDDRKSTEIVFYVSYLFMAPQARRSTVWSGGI